jgi:hypothetical protein
MGADFRLGPDLLAIGIAIVGDRFFASDRGLAIPLVLALFFPTVDDVDLAAAAGFFFLVGVPIRIFMGIFDFEESRAVCCGRCARAGAITKTEMRTSAEARRHE